MNFTKGDDKILFIKINGVFLPIGCLTENSMNETVEFIDTTTRDNKGWKTEVPLIQSYGLSFSGLQVVDASVATYDKLKELKRNKTLLNWKIQGSTFPTVDYGQCYISELSDSNPVGDFITFSGSAKGFGPPRMASRSLVLANNGDTTLIVNYTNTVLNTAQPVTGGTLNYQLNTLI